MGIGVGCWRVWRRWDGCLWCRWRRGCVRGFGIRRVQALGRVAAYGWALGARYRVEQVFGSVKGVDGSSVGCRRWCYARVQVWGIWSRQGVPAVNDVLTHCRRVQQGACSFQQQVVIFLQSVHGV